ncbi:uroporphyrinogen-III synthase [Sulfitobacter guttiformis]|uniref:Uroporphyrinogen-III synthase n=1 Tax=Sulfitobacter guttiformis TaxID=74349 RepID=A0A420DSC7_9RHOB|nr:uroporphyrinogen-III synthase [Sulfitobacter guttiformis]KIN74466.1 Uroporphyrinogen-III synthase [Sulfitobacter guttiformis KCTC 32187]RKE97063.1 uroporphyrinogen-III synthase [Sulfitobacter guttiformis]
MAVPTLLLTRPSGGSHGFAAALDPSALARVRLLVAPLMEITGTLAALAPHDVQAAIFTSANGVDYAPDGRGRPAFCVGTVTTAEAKRRGWDAQLSGKNAHELIARLREMRPVMPLVHLGGAHTIGDIAETLTAEGITTRHIAIYQQTLLPLDPEAMEALKAPCIVPVFSLRSAAQLSSQAQGLLEHAHIIALSDSVACPFHNEKTAQCLILQSPQAIYMRKAVENLCWNLSLP